jgi:RNA polymerase sigma-70 factor (ECF subfamily)
MTHRFGRGRGDWDWDQVRALCLREAQRVLGRHAAAEDAAQEAVTRAWRRRASCQTPDSPEPWIAAIARREALRLAARRSDVPLHAAEDAVGVAGGADELVQGVDVRRAVATMSDADRRLLLARYWGDLTQPQAAHLLGIAEGTVKVRLHRARATLRAALSSP